MSKSTSFIKKRINPILLIILFLLFVSVKSQVTKICEKTSSEFARYYRLGDTNILGMDEENTKKYDSEHIKALINIVDYYYGNKKAKKNGGNAPDPSENKKQVYKYIYHILPLIIILGIGILSLFGWLTWIICVCNKCKCCLCKSSKFKTPSIVLAVIFYLIVVLISIYSLAEKNKVFSGLANLECSVIKFTEEVINGEKSPYPPLWAGIDNIRTTLGKITEKIDALKPGTITGLQNIRDDADTKKGIFENSLKNAGNKIKSQYINNDYQLDIAKQFGTYDDTNNKGLPEDSVCNYWINEYKSLYTRSYTEMTNTIDDSFSTILSDNDIIQSITEANNNLENIKNEFKILQDLTSDYIIKKADDVDKIGRVVYDLFFSILVIFCGTVAVFMLFLCCCSGKICTNLSFFQCIFKYFLHVFWNIMALIMFILFMGGSMFTISGALGNDLVGVISFLISEDNLGQDKDTIILENVKKYLNKCFNGNGNILDELQFNTKMENFEKLKKSFLAIEEIKNYFNDKLNKFVYTEYLEELTTRAEFSSEDFSILSVNDGVSPSSYNFVDLLSKINEYANGNSHLKKENWNISSTATETCTDPDNTSPSDLIIYHPKKCFPTFKQWVKDEASLSIYVSKLNDMKSFIELANNNNPNSIKELLNGLNTDYSNFLNSEIIALQGFIDKMKVITDLVNDYTSEDDEFFSFMNCNFIKTNVEVILHYFKTSIGNDIYEVGIYLLIAAFCMPFAISFTILLIVISNDEIEKNKEENKKKDEKYNQKIIEENEQKNKEKEKEKNDVVDKDKKKKIDLIDDVKEQPIIEGGKKKKKKGKEKKKKENLNNDTTNSKSDGYVTEKEQLKNGNKN